MRLLVTIAALALGGCAGYDKIAEYRGTTLVHYQDARDDWRIFDKPNEGRVMITPSLGKLTGQALAQSATFGIVDTSVPKPIYQDAVEGWLRMQGRSCRVTDGYVLQRPQWEFKYTCS